MTLNFYFIPRHLRVTTLLAVLVLATLARSTAAAPYGVFGKTDTAGAAADSVSHQLAGWIIDSIEIDNRNIYDLEDDRYQGYLFQTANRLHIVTREQIIRRELLFKVGDPLDPDLAAETARNLRLRYPVNDAWIELEELGPGRVMVRVVTIDQWSLLGGLRSIDRDGSQTDFRFGIEERNFLGRAQFISVDVFVKQEYPDHVKTVYRQPRLMGRPWSFGLEYDSNPLDRLKAIVLAHPYYNLSQRLEFRLAYEDRATEHRRLDAYGEAVARWMTHKDQLQTDLGYRFGPPNRKLALTGSYVYSSSHIRDTVSLTDTVTAAAFPLDSTYHTFALGAQYWKHDYIVERRLDGFGSSEDVTLGFQVGALYGRAFLPDFRSHYHDLVSGEVSWRGKVGQNLLSAGYVRSYWLKNSAEIRRTSGFLFSWYNNSLPFLTLALKSRYDSDRGGVFQRLVLGAKNGLRGYPTEYSAGNRLHVINSEARFFSGLELLSVKLGAAVYGDIGRTWLPGEAVAIEGYHWNIGAGLRFSLENLLRGEVVRIDLTRTEDAVWDLSVGTGQYF